MTWDPFTEHLAGTTQDAGEVTMRRSSSEIALTAPNFQLRAETYPGRPRLV